MKLSEMIAQLQKIADQGDDWKDAEVELDGTEEENYANGGPSSIVDIQSMDFGDHLSVFISKE